MKKIRLSLKDRSYDIVVGSSLLGRSGPILKRLGLGRDAVIISNKAVSSLYQKRLERSLAAAGLNMHVELVPDSERAKSLAILSNLLGRIGRYDRNRSVFIIAFGGGVIGDIAGFTAAIYKRGVPYVQIPTTLLAQVDSAIGGKTAVDLPVAKNLIGAFYQPRIVLSDISLTASLPARQLRNGLAEIIKYGVIKDARLFEYLEKNRAAILKYERPAIEHIVLRSSSIKAKIVEEDELDKKGIRAILNYGHTIGHAIEAAAGYSNKYNHGEAVGIGMVAAARIALKLGMTKTDTVIRITEQLESYGLPLAARGLSAQAIYNSLLHDKKFMHGKNRFILPVRIGSVRVAEDVPDRLVKDAIREAVI